jgi:hypothetical protein
MSFNVKLSVSIMLAVILAGFVFVKTLSVSNPFVTCYLVRTIEQLAPDKKHDFNLVEQYCEGGATASSDSYWVTVHDLTKPGDQGIRIFYTWDYAPDVSWLDSQRIVITIVQVCLIRTSLHQAGAIEITYRLSDDLLEESFRNKIDDYVRRAIDAGESLTSDTSNPGALKNRVEFSQMQYRQLREWAAVNAVNGRL